MSAVDSLDTVAPVASFWIGCRRSRLPVARRPSAIAQVLRTPIEASDVAPSSELRPRYSVNTWVLSVTLVSMPNTVVLFFCAAVRP